MRISKMSLWALYNVKTRSEETRNYLIHLAGLVFQDIKHKSEFPSTVDDSFVMILSCVRYCLFGKNAKW